MSLKVLAPGLLTSVQAGARHGSRHFGVASSGAMDEYSWRVGNLLVGNQETAAALEITLQGPRLQFERPVRIAITGADIDARIGDSVIPAWRPVSLPAGTELRLGNCRRGMRAYLAVSGGVDLPDVLGSASTDLRDGFGGLSGRALVADDQLVFKSTPNAVADKLEIAHWWIDPTPDLDWSQPCTIRFLPGSDPLSAPEVLVENNYRVSPASNRQGLRLQGPGLSAANSQERVSGPVAAGTVQLPPDGQPIVLLADAQTIGGYPCIGHVVRTDWPRLAQLRPGDFLRFQKIDHATARELACGQWHRLARIAVAVGQRLAPTSRLY